jgi:hypothetical protein
MKIYPYFIQNTVRVVLKTGKPKIERVVGKNKQRIILVGNKK